MSWVRTGVGIEPQRAKTRERAKNLADTGTPSALPFIFLLLLLTASAEAEVTRLTLSEPAAAGDVWDFSYSCAKNGKPIGCSPTEAIHPCLAKMEAAMREAEPWLGTPKGTVNADRSFTVDLNEYQNMREQWNDAKQCWRQP